MRIAAICSNSVKIGKNTKKGTEIFDFTLLNYLSKLKNRDVQVTAFTSGDSKLPVKIESINYRSSFEDKNIGMTNHKIFEVALAAKAFAMQDKFDLYHVNIGNGEIVLPFAQFVKKPILITLHGTLDDPYIPKYFPLFKNYKNVYFISISDAQRKPFPSLNFIKTIHHGLDIEKLFRFNPVGDKHIIWSGRAIPEKGLDIVLSVVKRVKKSAKVFPMIKEDYLHWLHDEIIKKRNLIYQAAKIYIDFDVNRKELNHHYQSGKLFLFPLQWEEPFGLTLIESMACGTPVVAYGRGSIPEIVKDGETGFIINPSDEDIRGNWIIKKTGVEGLCEAVNYIYSMQKENYEVMRKTCRAHVEKNFSVERMIEDYVNVYKQILSKK